jgi:hypothetical protein
MVQPPLGVDSWTLGTARPLGLRISWGLSRLLRWVSRGTWTPLIFKRNRVYSSATDGSASASEHAAGGKMPGPAEL